MGMMNIRSALRAAVVALWLCGLHRLKGWGARELPPARPPRAGQAALRVHWGWDGPNGRPAAFRLDYTDG